MKRFEIFEKPYNGKVIPVSIGVIIFCFAVNKYEINPAFFTFLIVVSLLFLFLPFRQFRKGSLTIQLKKLVVVERGKKNHSSYNLVDITEIEYEPSKVLPLWILISFFVPGFYYKTPRRIHIKVNKKWVCIEAGLYKETDILNFVETLRTSTDTNSG